MGRDFWKGGRSAAVPRHYQTLDDQDFDVKVYLEDSSSDLAPKTSERYNDHGVYLRIGGDDKKFYRWSVHTDGSGPGGDDYKLFVSRIDDNSNTNNNLKSQSTLVLPEYIGIKQEGQLLTFYYKMKNNPETAFVSRDRSIDSDVIDAIGLFAANGLQPNIPDGYTGSFQKFLLDCPNDCNSGSVDGDPHFSVCVLVVLFFFLLLH